MGRRFRGDAGPMDTGTDRQSFCFGVDFFIQIWYKQQKIYVRYNIAMGKSIAAYERKLRKNRGQNKNADTESGYQESYFSASGADLRGRGFFKE